MSFCKAQNQGRICGQNNCNGLQQAAAIKRRQQHPFPENAQLNEHP
jgi:hypothetical protein